MPKITFSIPAPFKTRRSDVYETIKKDIDSFFLKNNKKLEIDWYNDMPKSPGVSATITFNDLESFTLLCELQKYLRQRRYTFYIILGY